MSGVIVSVKGRYAVLLTKNSDFIKVKNKNYSVGDKVKIPQEMRKKVKSPCFTLP